MGVVSGRLSKLTASATTYTATYKANAAPTITNVAPAPDSSTKDRTPTIRARVLDAETDLVKSNISLYVDGIRVAQAAISYNTVTDRLIYTPASDMAFGWHRIKIVALDGDNATRVRQWKFRITRQ
jgi:hypothetical protein